MQLALAVAFACPLAFVPTHGVRSLSQQATVQRTEPHPPLVVPELLGFVPLAFATKGKRIEVTWERRDVALRKRQSFATSYQPTAVGAPARDGELLVAGTRRNGNTVIERWTFRPPALIAPAVGAQHLEEAVVVDIETLYDEARPRRDAVLRLVPMPRLPQRALVQFDGSKDVHELVWSDAVSTLQRLTSDKTWGLPRRGFQFSWSRDHRTRGVVLVFGDEGVPDSTFVLVDCDRDGTIDESFGVSDGEWRDGDWGDGNAYIP